MKTLYAQPRGQRLNRFFTGRAWREVAPQRYLPITQPVYSVKALRRWVRRNRKDLLPGVTVHLDSIYINYDVAIRVPKDKPAKRKITQ